MSVNPSVRNSATFGVRHCDNRIDQRWSGGCNDPAIFWDIISSNIQKPNNAALAMALPKNSPLKNFHIQGLLHLAKEQPSCLQLVNSWLTNYKCEDPAAAADARAQVQDMLYPPMEMDSDDN